LGRQVRRSLIQRADIGHFDLELIVVGRRQPVTHQMGLQIVFFTNRDA
jgi:hypothetical protein